MGYTPATLAAKAHGFFRFHGSNDHPGADGVLTAKDPISIFVDGGEELPIDELGKVVETHEGSYHFIGEGGSAGKVHGAATRGAFQDAMRKVQ